MGNLLDSLNLITETHATKKVFLTIEWWEKRRLQFNFILITAVLIPVFMVWDLLDNVDFPKILLFLISNLVIGNIIFCLVWAMELLRWHYFKIKTIGKNNTWNFTLFLLFSFGLTFLSTYALLQHLVTQ